MGRYRSYTRQEVKERPWEVHPIWRGLGCLLIILIPIMAYAGAVVIVRANFVNRWVALPTELTRYFVIPYLGVTVYYAVIAVTLLLLFLGYGILVLVYAFMYRLVGPSRYGPLDSPPIKRKPKKRR
jgi:ABC-type Fe3+ transport system permease subunit